MANEPATRAFRGTFVHTPVYGNVDFLVDKLVVVRAVSEAGQHARIPSCAVRARS
jgi:hypothetical protein